MPISSVGLHVAAPLQHPRGNGAGDRSMFAGEDRLHWQKKERSGNHARKGHRLPRSRSWIGSGKWQRPVRGGDSSAQSTRQMAIVVTTSALTLFWYAEGFNPSLKMGEGLPIRLPFSFYGRRGWGMRVVRYAKSNIAGLIGALGNAVEVDLVVAGAAVRFTTSWRCWECCRGSGRCRGFLKCGHRDQRRHRA